MLTLGWYHDAFVPYECVFFAFVSCMRDYEPRLEEDNHDNETKQAAYSNAARGAGRG